MDNFIRFYGKYTRMEDTEHDNMEDTLQRLSFILQRSDMWKGPANVRVNGCEFNIVPTR